MGKSSRAGARMSSGRGRRTDVVQMFSAPRHSWVAQIVGLLIRGRAELALLAVVIMVWPWFTEFRDTTDPVVFYLVVIGVPVLWFSFRPTRRLVTGRFWAVLDRHRLRTCFREARIRTMNMSGALPFLLWARPTKTGERIWVWVRAGSSSGDIEDTLEYLAPACFARDARVNRIRKTTTMVTIDIIRRDPLATGQSVFNPLTAISSAVSGAVKGEGTAPIEAATITDITAKVTPNTGESGQAPITDAPGTAQRRPTKPAKTAKPTQQVEQPTVVVNGEDLSDYVD